MTHDQELLCRKARDTAVRIARARARSGDALAPRTEDAMTTPDLAAMATGALLLLAALVLAIRGKA